MSIVLWSVYAAGAAAGFLLTDASPPRRVLLAVLWPVGPLAFVGTAVGLLFASLIAFPAFGALVALMAVAWWWLAKSI